jgi:hypothetical protein
MITPSDGLSFINAKMYIAHCGIPFIEFFFAKKYSTGNTRNWHSFLFAKAIAVVIITLLLQGIGQCWRATRALIAAKLGQRRLKHRLAFTCPGLHKSEKLQPAKRAEGSF